MPNYLASPSYYRNRAIVRKIELEGTGIMPDRMTTRELLNMIERHVCVVREHTKLLDHSSPTLARAVFELDSICTELVLRGVQLSLPI